MEEATQRELEQFVEAEQQKARFQSAVHNFTDLCWEKCISKPGNKLERSDEACLTNCVERFVDVGNQLVQRLQENRGR